LEPCFAITYFLGNIIMDSHFIDLDVLGQQSLES